MTDNDSQMDADELLAYDMDTSEDAIKVPFIGLNNLGNTCFFNSILQMLYYCPDFRRSLFEVEKKIRVLSNSQEIEKLFLESKISCIHSVEEAKDKCILLLELYDLFTLMRNNQASILNSSCKGNVCDPPSSVRPEALMNILRKAYPAFGPYMQQDAQECLRCILSILQDGISIVCRQEKVKAPEYEIEGKLFGGRKLDAESQASTTTERSQIENRDPNPSSVKQDSRSTALRKRKVKTFLKKPLRIKSSSVLSDKRHSSSALMEKNDWDNKGVVNGEDSSPLVTLDGNKEMLSSSESVKDSGCFSKFKRGKVETKKPIPSLAGTPTKRLSEEKLPSTSPPFKKKKLLFGSGIKNFYKPISSTMSSSKSLALSGTKKSYAVVKPGGPKTNPFKVMLKAETTAKYTSLDVDNCSEADSKTVDDHPRNNGDESNTMTQLADGNHAVESCATNFIEDLFQGQLVNEIRCMECENSLRRKESFMDISLPVEQKDSAPVTTECSKINQKAKQHCSVIWGLTKFASREILEGENKYHCEHCNRYVEGEKRLQFENIPPLLTLHLKRFSAVKSMVGGDAFSSTVTKINSALNVPFQLCLEPWCVKSCKNRDANYRLFGIVIHSGATISSGHYLSYVRLSKTTGLSKDTNGVVMDDKLQQYDGMWLEADDENARILSEEELMAIISPQETDAVSRTPYLLFYAKDDICMKT